MDELNGIAVINKEKGYTSHDVVNVVRKILGTRKVGHTGTLDPNAEGVLPICVGKSTKVCDMLTFSDKEYIAEVRLGITTDTLDIWGKTLTECRAEVDFECLSRAVSHFVGEISQIPPMYSAIKKNGKKLYELARDGVTIELEPRKVTVYSCDILEYSDNVFKIKVNCSKGTYIRSLCRDIGEYLGCGACMISLVRTKASFFDIKDSVSLEEFKKDVILRGGQAVLRCPDILFNDYGDITVGNTVKQRLLNGAYSLVKYDIGTYRVYDEQKTFVGIAEVSQGQKGNVIKLIKGFI